ncbi:MAG TPA: GH92 family glycosyl hydrolase [Verrucomicrobiae bacterium]|jgi:predicted alpha-1,2-mannosidase
MIIVKINTLASRLIHWVSVIVLLVVIGGPGKAADLTQFINPFIGTDNGGDCFPGADMPQGMVQWSPDTTTAPGGYRYSDTVISRGFSLTHFSGRGVGVYQDFPFMPVVGNLSASPAITPTAYGAGFSHTNETALAGYYSVLLDTGIQVELTVTPRSGMGRFTYPSSTQANMIINLNGSANGNSADAVSIVGANEVAGQTTSAIGGSGASYTIYFAALFDHAFTGFGVWNGGILAVGARTNSNSSTAAYVTFDTTANPVVLARVGVSFVSVSNALLNLNTENPGWDFNAVWSGASNAWNSVSSRIQVTGGTGDEQTVFYTALYHSYIHPNIYSDVNGQYVGFDGVVHTQGNHVQYENISSWDSYRGLTQLTSFLSPNEASDVAQSLVNDAAQGGGAMPQWEQASANSANMVGDGPTINAANAYAFGATNFDLQSAFNAADYSALTVGATSGGKQARPGLSDYLNLGYVSTSYGVFNGNVDSAPAVTLEYANNDFALSQLALALGNTNKYQAYLARSGNWRNVFNPASLWVQSRNSDGSWESSFTLTTSMVESDSYTYTWMTPFDLRGLFDAMGGNTVVTQRLDTHFTQLNAGESSIYANMGNEPEEEAPWEYDFADAPWETQNLTRQCELQLWSNSSGGMPGNDDGGAMSSWMVWAMMGIYPEIPGVGGFVIGSPIFTSVTITPESGHVVQISAPAAADTNQYVQSLLLNGQPSSQLWLPMGTILGAADTTLDFTLTNTPNINWGSADSNAPPSFPDGAVILTPPVVSIVAPTNGAIFLPGTNITFNATASSSNGPIVNVQLFQSSTSLAVLTNAPYNFVWSNVPDGYYTIYAATTDSSGAVGSSTAINLYVVSPGQGNNLTTTASQGSGSSWSDSIWQTNSSGTLLSPIPGNTYEEIYNSTKLAFGAGNTRVRNPTANGPQTFPGNSLTMDTNTEIRFKDTANGNYQMVFPGVGNNPGLILKGGLLNDGDSGNFILLGGISVAGGSFSCLAPGGNLGNAPPLTEPGRTLTIGATLSGNGTLAVILTPTNNPILVTNNQNTFSGQWIVQEGWLMGTAPQSLGVGSFIVDPLAGNANNPQALSSLPALTLETANNGGGNAAQAVLDFSYPAVCAGTVVLTNGGLMNLHANCTFGGMKIEGNPLSPGLHTYAQLSSTFTNFLPGGSGSITITGPTPPAIGDLSMQAEGFSASFKTVYGAQYQILSATNLALPLALWTVLATLTGNGSTMSFTDTSAPAAQACYYQIAATEP